MAIVTFPRYVTQSTAKKGGGAKVKTIISPLMVHVNGKDRRLKII